ncbi:hypothetical protein OTB20_12050 [Streptomyces sp. H27-H1]|uniref:DUF6907 domain-containing protein n=1 Tax=Streptomyces sp. H27-H1 TaxID=2996461 RepID=UPI00226EDBF9|nr:hypothetical protein [Streptomyces sp. H27-H1]MCY0926923.1 hypothetical protein [Streptomyces sp. H27-H1]
MTIIADQPQATKVEPGQLGGPILATVRRTLAAGGIDQAVIDEAVQAVAAGQVYQAATASVKEQDGHGVRPFFDCLDRVIDHIVTGTPLTAAREAAEALATPTVQPGHHPWCVTSACTPERFDDGEVLTEHHGPRYEADVTDGAETIQLWAELGSDENFIDGRAQVFMAAGKADGLAFHSDELGKVINELGEFVDGLRHLHRVMGQARAPKTEASA